MSRAKVFLCLVAVILIVSSNVFAQMECLFVSAAPDPGDDRDIILVEKLVLDWGYNVTVVSSDELGALTESDFAAYDFCFASETVNSTSLAPLKGHPLPVFTTEAWSSRPEALCWSDPASTSNYDTQGLVIVDDTNHPLSAGFPEGAEVYPVFDTDVVGEAVIACSPTIDFIPIASLTTDPLLISVLGVEAGVELTDGTLTQNRAACVGIHASAYQYISDEEGYLLIKAGIDWITGGGGVSSDWSSTDLGTPQISGSMSESADGVITIQAAGIDIWNEADEGHFVYQEWTEENLELTARFVSVESADDWSKGCVMIRESLDAGARHYSVFSGYLNQLRFGKRAEAGGSSSSMKPKDESGADISDAAYDSKPVWLKIIREGTTFNGYFSTDGNVWKQIGTTDQLDIPTMVYVGVALTSHNPDASVTGVFDNITMSKDITIDTRVENSIQNVPELYELFTNYPNPFNPTTNIRFALSQNENIRLSVYNISGQEMTVLFEGQKAAGLHTLTFSAGNFPAGIYFTKLEVGNRVFSKKMMLIK